jgi:hypothetical protein
VRRIWLYVTALETPSGVEDQAKPGKKAAKAIVQSSKAVGKKARPPVLNYPGLDPSAVAAALQAGVPSEHLSLMSRAIAGKPRLGEQTALDPSSKKQDNDQQDSEAESDPDGVDAAADPMTAALLQLTKIVSKLSASKKADPCGSHSSFEEGFQRGSEEAMDRDGSQHARGLCSLNGSTKHCGERLLSARMGRAQIKDPVLPTDGALGMGPSRNYGCHQGRSDRRSSMSLLSSYGSVRTGEH